jgi:hypothetical protein
MRRIFSSWLKEDFWKIGEKTNWKESRCKCFQRTLTKGNGIQYDETDMGEF